MNNAPNISKKKAKQVVRLCFAFTDTIGKLLESSKNVQEFTDTFNLEDTQLEILQQISKYTEKKIRPKDPKAPKRPLTSFMRYSLIKRKEVKDMKEIGRQWKNERLNVKTRYITEYSLEKKEYDIKMEKYIAPWEVSSLIDFMRERDMTNTIQGKKDWRHYKNKKKYTQRHQEDIFEYLKDQERTKTPYPNYLVDKPSFLPKERQSTYRKICSDKDKEDVLDDIKKYLDRGKHAVNIEIYSSETEQYPWLMIVDKKTGKDVLNCDYRLAG